MKITPREKRRLSPRRVSSFLAWVDFHARSRFARSTISEEKWGTTRSLFCHALGLKIEQSLFSSDLVRGVNARASVER